MELAYSLHLGSNKNNKNSIRKSASKNISRTTSLSNNSIQNATQLSRVDKHNYRKYDYKQDDVVIIRGSNSLVNDVKELYKKEFDKSLKEFNDKQTRNDRKIKDYFNHISNDNKHDLACEIIIELGNKEYWDSKDMNFKKRMISVYTKQVSDLEMLVPNFKVASSIIHFDETSPHIHIVGVPIKEKNKYGMSIQVGKSDVFTKESLRKLQDKMRVLCIEEFNKEYNLNNTLKAKKKGSNKDYLVSEMENYIETQKRIEKHQENINKINIKSLELENNSSEIKDIVDNLKPTISNKYVLKQNDKDKILNYIEQVNNTNNDLKKVKDLPVSLSNIEDKINENIILTENNKALNLRVSVLENKIDKQDKKLEKLEKENNILKKSLKYVKDKVEKLINYMKDKMFHKDRDKYMDFSRDLYNHGILDIEEMYSIKKDYDYSKNNDKNKDDFGLSR